MTTEVWPFEYALREDEENDGQRFVLLGNGWSRAYSPAFAYGQLAEQADFQAAGLSVDGKKLFEQVGTVDFEGVMKTLQDAAKVMDLYAGDSSARDRVEGDVRAVARGLTLALTQIHPPASTSVPDEKYRSARSFLSHFDQIFTLNYDLLLYWVTMRKNCGSEVPTNDGFGGGHGVLSWKGPDALASQQVVHYLHGAFHLYTAPVTVNGNTFPKMHKLSGTANLGMRLLEIVLNNIQNDQFPRVVTEGSLDAKREAIQRSAYMRHCLNRFSELKGSLFIFGMALSDNDDHILDALSSPSSRVTHLFVSLHGGASANQKLIEKANALASTRQVRGGSPLTVHFYDAGSAKPWG